MPDPIFLSGDAIPDYLRGVELLTVGMEWPASTGPATITLEHLADAVRAFSDPHIQPPRIKLGHCSPLNGNGEDHNPFAALGDAEPSFGQFTNLRLENDGAVLVGDATNVPAWLAAIAPSAYPNRSSEAVFNVDCPVADVQTNGGRRYSCVITAVSLLGVALPAIGDLEDLTALTMNGPAALNAAITDTPSGAALSVSHATIRDRFNWDWACGRVGNDFDGDTTWWWARDVRVDPDEIIADDDDGHLWSVPFTTDGEDEVTFGDPSRVRETFVPLAASTTVAASFSRPNKQAERPAAIAAAKPSRKPAAVAATNSAAVEQPYEGESTMPVTDQVREFLVGRGIDPDTATEVQINAATVLMAEQPEGEAPEEPEAEVPETPEAEAETPAAERVPVAASRQIPEGMSLIDSATLAELKAGANAGTQLAREKATETRDRVLSAARDEGRFPPARLAHYTKLYDADPEGTTVLLTAAEDKGGLAKGTVPLAARAQVPDPEAAEFAAGEPLPANVSLLTPDQRATLAARRA